MKSIQFLVTNLQLLQAGQAEKIYVEAPFFKALFSNQFSWNFSGLDKNKCAGFIVIRLLSTETMTGPGGLKPSSHHHQKEQDLTEGWNQAVSHDPFDPEYYLDLHTV